MSNISVITSGTSGIGRAIVKKILAESAEGDRVIVNYGHSDQAAEDLKNELPEKQRERLTLVKADLSDYDAMMEFAGKVKEMTDHIDWLVLNRHRHLRSLRRIHLRTVESHHQHESEHSGLPGTGTEAAYGGVRKYPLHGFPGRSAALFFLAGLQRFQGGGSSHGEMPGEVLR